MAFAGDPIDPSTAVVLVISGGEVVYRNPDVTPVEDDPPAVVDLSLPDRLPRRYVLKTGRLLGPEGTLAPGALLVADGGIEASGATIEAEGAPPIFDVGDAVISPGLLTAHSTLGQARAVAESAGADAGFLRTVDAFDPTGRTVRSLVRGGVLRAAFAPAPTNVIGGAVGMLRLGAKEPVVEPVAGMNLVLSSSSRSLERFPVSLPGQIALIRQFLGLQEENDPNPRRLLDYYLTAPAINRLDTVRRQRADLLRNGQCAAFVEVDDAAEVASALDLAEELGMCVALVGPGAIEDQADRIARLASEGPGILLVLRPLAFGPEASRRLSRVVDAVEAGAQVLFAAEDAEELRLLAASAVAAGLPRSEALRALTASGPNMSKDAKGSWQSGTPADFVIWDGSPLDLSSRPLTVVVDGQKLP